MKNSFVISLLLLFTSANLFAVDFYYQGPDGNTLLYTASTATSNTCTIKTQPASLNLTGEVIIPETAVYNGKVMTVTSIASEAFSNTTITCLTIPATCKPSGFKKCLTLKKVILSEGMTEIPERAFEDCCWLKEVVIPSTIKKINKYAFYYSGIEVLDLPDIDYLGEEAFGRCNNLRKVTLGRVTEIGGSVFNGSSQLQEVVLKEKIDIPQFTFCNASKLKSVRAEKGVGAIGKKAFLHCYELKDIIGFETATELKDSAFYDCHSLKKAHFPNVVGIYKNGSGVFENCYALEEATVSGSPRYYYFKYCSSLRRVDISRVNRLPQFDYCTSLERIQIPEGITSCAAGFEHTFSLKYIELPSTMKNMSTNGGYAFWGADEYDVYCHAKTPPSISSGTFCPGFSTTTESYKHPGTLHVYKDCIEAYKKVTYWNYFNIIGDLEDYDVTSHDLVDGVEYDMPFSREDHTTTYTRNFKNTNWQAWFVPFDTKIEDYADELEFAKVNNFFYKDGNTDTPYLNVEKVTSGIVEGSTPYLVRAKQAGEKVIRSVGKLYPAQTEYHTCTSVDTEFTFVGTYSGVSGEEMYENGYYAMTGGQITYASSPNANLAPYRWYVKLADRDGYEVPSFPRTIFISVDGEEATDILDLYDTQSPTSDTQVYNLQGQCVGSSINGLKPGIYVSAGRKFVVR